MDSMALDILQAPDSDTNHCYYEAHNPDSGHPGQGWAQITNHSVYIETL